MQGRLAGVESVQACGVGVRQTEPNLQCAVQAQAEQAGDPGICSRLGRPPPAHPSWTQKKRSYQCGVHLAILGVSHAQCCCAGLDRDVVLCCAVLCCAVLCCAVLCCAVLCCAVLCCAVLCCAVLCCAVLCCAVLCCAGQDWTELSGIPFCTDEAWPLSELVDSIWLLLKHLS